MLKNMKFVERERDWITVLYFIGPVFTIASASININRGVSFYARDLNFILLKVYIRSVYAKIG